MTDIALVRPPTVCDVLIVDDDKTLCDTMASFLQRRGLAVYTAPSPSTALAVLQRVQPRVAVLDYQLPGQSGAVLAERMREHLPALPIILMSGHVDCVERETLDRIGIKVFVNKPVPLTALHAAVLRLIRQDE
jgi:DNA-binding NtrC family response regulator